MVVAVKMPERVIAQEPAGSRSRDRELVRLVGRHGAMTVDQLQRAMRCGRTTTYRRIARCVERGYVQRILIPGFPLPILHATREGLRYAGLGLPVAAISPASITHMLRCTGVAVGIEKKAGPEAVLTEREILLEEQIEGKPVASVTLGSQEKARRHRADLAFESENGGLVAVEVELTPKSPARLRGIIKAWARAVVAKELAEVHYLCEPGQTHRAVKRAVTSAEALSRITVVEGTPGL
jgi:hypothetical protein